MEVRFYFQQYGNNDDIISTAHIHEIINVAYINNMYT